MSDSEISDWDNDEFEPPAVEEVKADEPSNNWDDEEGDDVPDDQLGQPNTSSKVASKVPKKYADMDRDELIKVIMDLEKNQAPKPKKKTTKQLIKEREEREREEELKRLASLPKLTPEEIAAKKIVEKRIREQEEDDEAAEFVGEQKEVILIEAMNPSTKEEFQTFGEAIVKKVAKYDASPHYVGFLEETLKGLVAELNADKINQVSKTLNVIKNEKTKQEKGKKKPKNKRAQLGGGGSSKGQLAELDGYGAVQDDLDEDDLDFM